MARRSVEDYLKAIYDLSQNGKPVSTTEISRTLKVAPASVTEMLKKLAEKGYIEHSPYHGTTLTSDGKRIAEKTVRKHRLLERFLHDVLKIDNMKVHKQACEMEHALAYDAEESLPRRRKNNPAVRPQNRQLRRMHPTAQQRLGGSGETRPKPGFNKQPETRAVRKNLFHQRRS